MAKQKRPKDDLQTEAKSRMAQMPAGTAGGRLDETARDRLDEPTGGDRRNMDPRRDSAPGRTMNPGRGMDQPHGMDAPDETDHLSPDAPTTGTPKPMSRTDKQRNQPRR